MIHGCKAAVKNGGFNLTKYVTNDYELLSTIDVNNRADEVRDLTSDMNNRALGVKFDVNEDAFYYVMKQVCARDDVTRRIMLSNIATMYDPLRLITPIAVRGKILFQEATRPKLDWDVPVPEDVATRWRAWLMPLHRASIVCTSQGVSFPTQLLMVSQNCISFVTRVNVCTM